MWLEGTFALFWFVLESIITLMRTAGHNLIRTPHTVRCYLHNACHHREVVFTTALHEKNSLGLPTGKISHLPVNLANLPKH